MAASTRRRFIAYRAYVPRDRPRTTSIACRTPPVPGRGEFTTWPVVRLAERSEPALHVSVVDLGAGVGGIPHARPCLQPLHGRPGAEPFARISTGGDSVTRGTSP